MSRNTRSVLLALAIPAIAIAQDPANTNTPRRDSARANPIQEGLPLKPERTIRFTTDVGSWLSLDVSPDGQTIVFDHLGDLFTIPMAGGKAVPLTRGMAVDAQPRFSPDGKRVVFVSDRAGASNLWIISLDKKDTVQVTRERTQSFDSPEFTPDGKYIIASRCTCITWRAAPERSSRRPHQQRPTPVEAELPLAHSASSGRLSERIRATSGSRAAATPASGSTTIRSVARTPATR
jgi:hypothetical protein